MSKVQNESSHPRATIHKRILEVAAEREDASLEEIAAETTGASIELVERVLSEYGDPGTNDIEPGENERPESTVEKSRLQEQPIPEEGAPKEEGTDLDQLSDKQIQTLRTIQDHPEATQREIADILDVCPATICNRVNDIEGFEWNSRRKFVNGILNENSTMSQQSKGRSNSAKEVFDRLDELEEKLEFIEQQLTEHSDKKQSIMVDPAFIHKMLHACIKYDQITEDEELRMIEILLQSDTSARA